MQESGFRVLTTHAPAYVAAETSGYSNVALEQMDRDIEEFIKLDAEPWLYFYQTRKPDDHTRYFGVVEALAKHIKEKFPAVHPIFFFGNEPDWEVRQCAGAIASDFANEFWNGSRQTFSPPMNNSRAR